MKKTCFSVVLLLCLFLGNLGQAAGLNFKEYKNTKLGFSLEVPAEFVPVKLDADFPTLISSVDRTLLLMARTEVSLKSYTMRERQVLCEKVLKDTKKLKEGKIVKSEMLTIDGNPTMYFERHTPTELKNGTKLDIRQTAYSIAGPHGVAVITFNYQKKYEEKYQKIIPEIMSTFHLDDFGIRHTATGYDYSYILPRGFIIFKPQQDTPDHKFMATNLIGFTTGIMVVKTESNPAFKYFPATLAGLTKVQQEEIIQGEKARFESERQKDPAMEPFSDFQGEFITVNKMPCLKMSFFQGKQMGKQVKSESYIFADKGIYVAYDFIYDVKFASLSEDIVAEAVKSIRLTKEPKKIKTGHFHQYKESA